MELDIKKFVRKPFEVEGLQVTEENMPYVAEWCKGQCDRDGDGPFIQVKVLRALNPRQTKAYAGDWVLKTGKSFKVYTDRAFHQTFTPKA